VVGLRGSPDGEDATHSVRVCRAGGYNRLGLGNWAMISDGSLQTVNLQFLPHSEHRHT